MAFFSGKSGKLYIGWIRRNLRIHSIYDFCDISQNDNLDLTPQGKFSLQGTFGVWTDVKVHWTKADMGKAEMYNFLRAHFIIY